MPEQPDQTEQVRILQRAEDTVPAAVELIASARRSLCIFSFFPPAPACFNAVEFTDVLRHQAVHEQRLQCRLLLPPAATWRQNCPQLTQLIERLSAIELRTPPSSEPTDQAEFGQSFLIADERAVLLMKDPRRCLGEFNADDPLGAKRLMDFFNPLWEKSQLDLELRRLGI